MPCTEIPEVNFTLHKDSDETKSFRYKADTLAVDITGYQIFFECSVASLSREAVIVDALDGRYDIIFVKADTIFLLDSRVKYEVVFYPNGITGEKVTKYKGSINLINEVITPAMLVEKYSGSERLDATTENFPALKHLWDKNNINGGYLMDTVGTQHALSSEDHWYVDEDGFAKWAINGHNQCPVNFEAPADRDFMLIGVGRIAWTTREFTLGQQVTHDWDTGPVTPPPAGIGLSGTAPPNTAAPAAFLNEDNWTDSAQLSFTDELAAEYWYTNAAGNVFTESQLRGAWATVISPTAGTCKGYWAGRAGNTASYDPMYEEWNHLVNQVGGSIQGTWPEIGHGLTMFPGNRFEWVALIYFESGAPSNMEEAMRWMAQYDDIRIYPGWKGYS